MGLHCNCIYYIIQNNVFKEDTVFNNIAVLFASFVTLNFNPLIYKKADLVFKYWLAIDVFPLQVTTLLKETLHFINVTQAHNSNVTLYQDPCLFTLMIYN